MAQRGLLMRTSHLRTAIGCDMPGGKLESPSIDFGEDSDSILLLRTFWPVSPNTNARRMQSKPRTESTKVISAYEQKIEKLECEKIILHEKVQNCGRPVADFDDTFRTAMVS